MTWWSKFKGLVGTIVLLVVVYLMATLLGPKSSPGIEYIGTNTAVLQSGQVLVIVTPSGKVPIISTFSYDGNLTVHVTCACDTNLVTLEPGKRVNVAVDWRDPVSLIQQEPGVVTITWPGGSSVSR